MELFGLIEVLIAGNKNIICYARKEQSHWDIVVMNMQLLGNTEVTWMCRAHEIITDVTGVLHCISCTTLHYIAENYCHVINKFPTGQ